MTLYIDAGVTGAKAGAVGGHKYPQLLCAVFLCLYGKCKRACMQATGTKHLKKKAPPNKMVATSQNKAEREEVSERKNKNVAH